jgi:hypothetical protein
VRRDGRSGPQCTVHHPLRNAAYAAGNWPVSGLRGHSQRTQAPTAGPPHTQAELAELFGIGRSTIYPTIERMRSKRVELSTAKGQIATPSGAASGRV